MSQSSKCKEIKKNLSEPEKNPEKNELPYCWDRAMSDFNNISAIADRRIDDDIKNKIVKDMLDRDSFGYEKYKTRLQPLNGRDPKIDFYQEILDATVYLEQEIMEEEYKLKNINAEHDFKSDAYKSYMKIHVLKTKTLKQLFIMLAETRERIEQENKQER